MSKVGTLRETKSYRRLLATKSNAAHFGSMILQNCKCSFVFGILENKCNLCEHVANGKNDKNI